MRLRYEQLFTIDLRAAYYSDNEQHGDFIVEPTTLCKKQMSRFKILSKKSANGIALFYECSPATNDATPFKKIAVPEKFTFKVTVTNADFWYYADVNNWQKDKIFYLKNPFFNATGDIPVLTGSLNAPILFRPMEFKYDVLLKNTGGSLEVRDSSGGILQTIIVRAKTASEPVGKTESYFIKLSNYADGNYILRCNNSGVNVDEQVYCSTDYSTDALAIIEITYKGDIAWTGVAPFQRYNINIASRLTDWFFDVYVEKKAIPPFLAGDLSILHIPVPPETLKTFNPVSTAIELGNGLARFASSAQIPYSQKPLHLKLLRTGAVTVLDPLPLPSAMFIQKDIGNNLINRIVVNV